MSSVRITGEVLAEFVWVDSKKTLRKGKKAQYNKTEEQVVQFIFRIGAKTVFDTCLDYLNSYFSIYRRCIAI